LRLGSFFCSGGGATGALANGPRQGIEIEREAREIDIYSLDLIDFAPSNYPEITFRTVCSTGTYVRTLGDDIAQALGGRAHLSALRRVRNGSLHVDDSYGIETLEAAVQAGTGNEAILAARDGLPDVPELVVGDDITAGVRNGLSFPATALHGDLPEVGPVRVVDEEGRLVAVYRIDTGKASPEVVLG